MEKEMVNLPEMKLVGLTMRTGFKIESDPATGKIGPTAGRYFREEVPGSIAHRVKPGVTICVYTEYSSDYKGDYTYFIGEEVSSFDDQPAGLATMTIPAQAYACLMPEPGPMPHALIGAWKDTWDMENNNELGGKRAYVADFEIFDKACESDDPEKIRFDIYIGIKE